MVSLTSTDYDAIRLSVQVATAATVLSIPFGFAFAYLITFVKFRGKVLVEVFVNLPLTLPPVVVGYLLLLLLGKRGWLGSLLEQAGIIVSRRDGRWLRYRLTDDSVLELLNSARQLARRGKAGRRTARRPKASERAAR